MECRENQLPAARWARIAGLALAGILTAVTPGSACIEYDAPPVFDTSSLGCSSQPSIDRSFFPGIVTWQGSEMLVHSSGNDLGIYDIEYPSNPHFIDESHFTIGNVGDSDYDLQVWAMCDDCRYGFAFFKLAAVAIDLGTGNEPDLDHFDTDYSLPSLIGAMTFKHGTSQYLVAEDVQNRCTGGVGLFRVNGTDFDSMQFLECVVNDTGQPLTVKGGTYLQDNTLNDGDAYLWISTGSYVHALEVVGQGTGLHLDYVRQIDGMRALASGSHQVGFDVDLEHRAAVSVFYSGGFKVWEVNSLEYPTLKATLNDVSKNLVSLGYPFVWTAQGTVRASSATFDISELSNPQLLDDSFWDENLSWNNLPCIGMELGGAFTADSRYLFLSRWEKMQRFDFSDCDTNLPPVAGIEVDYWHDFAWTDLPAEVYPGELIRVRSTSSGPIDSTQIWITDSAGATVVQVSGGDDVAPLEYTIPAGGSGGEPSSSYTAHVAVLNSNGSDQANRAVVVNTSPQADFTYNPEQPLEGNHLSLHATAEGQPAVPEGSGLGDPFQWLITRPGGSQITRDGEDPPSFVLNEKGVWEIDLTVWYAHDTPPHTANRHVELDISNVSAAMTVYPAYPVTTGNLILNGSGSNWTTLEPPTWLWEFRLGAGSWQDLTPVCGATSECIIPGSIGNETLLPGTYDFRLTLSDPLDPDPENASVAQVDNVYVAPGSSTADFNWYPSSPEIGQTISFEVTGVSEVDHVVWDFGEPACNGTSQHATCTPSFIDCLSWAHDFPTGGPKAVSMTATVDGQTLPPVVKTLTVENTGSCPGGGCNYSINPSSRDIGPAGDTDLNLNLSVEASCPWSATTDVDWITFPNGSGGVGPAAIRYAVAPNPDSPRTGTITVQGLDHTVSQGFCTERLARWPDAPAPGAASQIVGLPGHVLVSGPTGIEVYDISNVQTPVAVRSLNTTGDGSGGLAACNDVAFVGGNDGLVTLVDVQPPHIPTELSTIVFLAAVHDLSCSKNLAFAAAGVAGLRIIDAADPENPQEIGVLNTPGAATGVAVLGDYAYVADGSGGLRVIDVMTPGTPSEVGALTDYSNAAGIAVFGNHAFVSDTDLGLSVVDVSFPGSPLEVSFLPLTGLTQLSTTGRHLYATTLGGDFLVFDVSHPESPVLITTYSGIDAESVAVSQGYALLGRGEFGFDIYLGCEGLLFCDGFQSGSTEVWSETRE